MRVPMVVCACICLTLVIAAQAPASPRVGVVDLNTVYEGYRHKAELEQEMRAAAQKIEEKLKGYETQVSALRDDMMLLEKGTSRYQELEKQAFSLLQEAKFEQQRASERLERQKRAAHEKLLGEINAAVGAYGAEQGFTLIVQREFTLRSETLSWKSVLYHAPAADLTQRILERLNAPR